MLYQENQPNISDGAESFSLQDPEPDQANSEEESGPEVQGIQTLWQRVILFKPRLPIYLLFLLLLFKLPIQFYTLKYVDYDESMYAARVMQILERPWRAEYNIESWPRRGFLIREELLFYVSAVFAKLFGMSYNSMKILPFISHISLFILTFIFCYRFFSYEIALLSSLFLFSQEQILLSYHHRIYCEYTITMCFIMLLTYLFFKEILKDEGQQTGHFILFGILLGIAFNIFKPVFTLLFTLFLFLIYKKRNAIFSKNYLVLGLSFIIGALPRINQIIKQKAFVYTHQGEVVSPLELSSWWLHLKTFPGKFSDLFNFFGSSSLYGNFIGYVFAIILTLLYIYSLKEVGEYLKKSKKDGQGNVRMDILLFIDIYLFLYMFTFIYVNDTITPIRYMYFVYPLIAIFFGVSATMVLEKFRLQRMFNIMVIFLLCLGVLCYANFIKHPDKFIYEGEQYARVKEEHVDKIFQFLNSKKIDHVFCARTLKWHLIFLSRGKVHASARYVALTPDNKVNLVPHPPNYAMTLEKRFFDTLTAENNCFLYTDKFMFVPPQLRDNVKNSFNNFLEINKGKYNIENIENFNIFYPIPSLT